MAVDKTRSHELLFGFSERLSQYGNRNPKRSTGVTYFPHPTGPERISGFLSLSDAINDMFRLLLEVG